MTAGFTIFGIGVPIYAIGLRSALEGPAWITAMLTPLLAARPLRRSRALAWLMFRPSTDLKIMN